MKKLKRKLTPIAFLLGVIIFFQGCTVYKGQNVTLDRAVEEVTKTKLVTNYGITHKFKRVEKEDGHYYGIKRTKGEIV